MCLDNWSRLTRRLHGSRLDDHATDRRTHRLPPYLRRPSRQPAGERGRVNAVMKTSVGERADTEQTAVLGVAGGRIRSRGEDHVAAGRRSHAAMGARSRTPAQDGRGCKARRNRRTARGTVAPATVLFPMTSHLRRRRRWWQSEPAGVVAGAPGSSPTGAGEVCRPNTEHCSSSCREMVWEWRLRGVAVHRRPWCTHRPSAPAADILQRNA